jgi:hypothetical protein
MPTGAETAPITKMLDTNLSAERHAGQRRMVGVVFFSNTLGLAQNLPQTASQAVIALERESHTMVSRMSTLLDVPISLARCILATCTLTA